MVEISPGTPSVLVKPLINMLVCHIQLQSTVTRASSRAASKRIKNEENMGQSTLLNDIINHQNFSTCQFAVHYFGEDFLSRKIQKSYRPCP